MKSLRDIPIPCLRWAGGKRRHIQFIHKLLPSKYETYYEPMVGGASVFLNFQPPRAVLGDNNPELINFYNVLRNSPDDLISYLKKLTASEEQYYEFRRWSPNDPLERAIRFAYLNRLSWNGLYRVNMRGEFNVPFGKRYPETLWDFVNLEKVSLALESALLFTGDFEQCIANVNPGDFIFFDPPYPRGALNGLGFNRYSSKFFSYEDHKRLANVATKLANLGTLILITESAHPDIVNLFKDNFNVSYIESKSLIASQSSKRRQVKEVLIHNYRV